MPAQSLGEERPKSDVKTHKEEENLKIDALNSNKSSSTGFQIYAWCIQFQNIIEKIYWHEKISLVYKHHPSGGQRKTHFT